jgi:hypothetical protein
MTEGDQIEPPSAGVTRGSELGELRRLWNQAPEQVRAAFLDEIPVEWLNAAIIRYTSRKTRKAQRE